ncbi:MAG: hypothetical protein HOE90_01280 [Bacteriovoracaceae bacterium]|jgi:penicillin-binding protein 1B|nr:hypothetical protein [Bacteriovoracaceae bacterium]
MVKKLTFIFLAVALGTALIFFGWCFYIISGSELNIFHEAKRPTLSPQKTLLESDSTVLLGDLKSYLIFSEEITEIKSKFESGDLVRKPDGYILVTKDLSLSPLTDNHCEFPYCYQHRLDFNKLPAKLWKGLIGIEDNRFLQHSGVDYLSILRALVADIKELKMVQGGSTLTQQLVKNLFLTNEKTIKRKLKEMILSVYIESKFRKEEILNAYLNEVFWGALQGVRIKGAYSASIFYFDKKISQLEDYEMAILISMLKGPYYYHPINKTKRLRGRVEIVFNKLKELNLIAASEKAWSERRWKRFISSLVKKNTTKPYLAFWKLTKKKKIQLFSEYESYVFNKVAREQLSRIRKSIKGDSDLAIKAVYLDIRCKDCKPYFYYSKEEKNSETAYSREKHQVGSILKPVIYKAYLGLGKSFDDIVSSGEISLNLKSGLWSPKEAYSIDDEELTVRQALQLSRNRPTIRIASELGFDNLEALLALDIEGLKSPLSEYPSQLIGAVELSVEQVANTYKKFLEAECYGRDENPHNGMVLDALKDPNITTLRKVISKRLKGFQFFGKTGTTNNGYDAWFVGFDGYRLAIIWAGHEGRRSDVKFPLSGAGVSFRVFQNFALRMGSKMGLLDCPTLYKDEAF